MSLCHRLGGGAAAAAGRWRDAAVALEHCQLPPSHFRLQHSTVTQQEQCGAVARVARLCARR
jgi:hypothetical protein